MGASSKVASKYTVHDLALSTTLRYHVTLCFVSSLSKITMRDAIQVMGYCRLLCTALVHLGSHLSGIPEHLNMEIPCKHFPAL